MADHLIEASEDLLAMSKDMVTEAIHANRLSSAEALSLLQSTHATLLALQQRETGVSATPVAQGQPHSTPANWKRSISKHAISCLECGDPFKQLSIRHLRLHDLDPRSYRTKYGIPSTQPLLSREAYARRRELAQEIRPWEVAAAKRAAASEAKAQTSGKATKAAKATPPRSAPKRAKSS